MKRILYLWQFVGSGKSFNVKRQKKFLHQLIIGLNCFWSNACPSLIVSTTVSLVIRELLQASQHSMLLMRLLIITTSLADLTVTSSVWKQPKRLTNWGEIFYKLMYGAEARVCGGYCISIMMRALLLSVLKPSIWRLQICCGRNKVVAA